MNNACSLKILEQLIDVWAHVSFIFQIVLIHMRGNPDKMMFCQAFLHTYTDVTIGQLLCTFKSARYISRVENVNLDSVKVLIAPHEKSFVFEVEESLLKTYIDERFEDAAQ